MLRIKLLCMYKFNLWLWLVCALSRRKRTSTLAWLGLCWCVERAPWTRTYLTWGSSCCYSWPLMSRRAGTSRRTKRWCRGKAEGDSLTPTSRRTSSSIVMHYELSTSLVNIRSDLPAKIFKPIEYADPLLRIYNYVIAVDSTWPELFMKMSLCCFTSHQRHHIQPEGPEDVHQPACALAPDQHGLSQRLSECPLPRPDVSPQEDHQLQTGCLPTAAWSVKSE